ncbi:MAG TPA: hypothetical protein VGR42_16410 [Casimicrobiaceae bacterium]|nr:hypothetical protein [Casimicrobiaceae bacterium]
MATPSIPKLAPPAVNGAASAAALIATTTARPRRRLTSELKEIEPPK